MDTTPHSVATVATVPLAILAALSRAVVGWTAAVYPGKTVHLEAASHDPATHRSHVWHTTARLSNGVRLRFTLVVHADGVAYITRHARLADGVADRRVRASRARDRDVG